jgi:hypothetical protein
MDILVREIKEMNNTELISALCYNMFDETKKAFLTQERICKELERRNIIESASDLYDSLCK